MNRHSDRPSTADKLADRRERRVANLIIRAQIRAAKKGPKS